MSGSSVLGINSDDVELENPAYLIPFGSDDFDENLTSEAGELFIYLVIILPTVHRDKQT